MAKSQGIRTPIKDQTRRSFVLRISEPRKSAHGDYFCRIDFPSVDVIGSNLKIFGIDAKQARALSLEYIRKTLANKNLMKI